MYGEEARALLSFQKILKENPYDEVTHKVFADWLSQRGLDDEAQVHYSWTKEKQQAEDWLRGLARGLSMTYEELLTEGDDIATGEYTFGSNSGPEIMRYNWENFLGHWSVLTGQKRLTGMDEYDTHFRCAC